MRRAADRAERSAVDRFRACEIAAQFLESFEFGAYEPTSTAGSVGPEFAMSADTDRRLLYGPTTERNWMLNGVSAGAYRVRWLDTATGEEFESELSVGLRTDSIEMTVPKRIDSEAVLLIEPWRPK